MPTRALLKQVHIWWMQSNPSIYQRPNDDAIELPVPYSLILLISDIWRECRVEHWKIKVSNMGPYLRQWSSATAGVQNIILVHGHTTIDVDATVLWVPGAFSWLNASLSTNSTFSTVRAHVVRFCHCQVFGPLCPFHWSSSITYSQTTDTSLYSKIPSETFSLHNHVLAWVL